MYPEIKSIGLAKGGSLDNAIVVKGSKIIKTEGSSIMEEGCLSVPDIRAEIKRPEVITLQYQDLNQNLYQEKFTGLVSRVIQHEIDHLSGKFF